MRGEAPSDTAPPRPLPEPDPFISFLAGRALVRRALYRSGSLTALLRLRSRDRLTVLGVHRVLPDHDARRAGAMPNFTLPAAVFGQMLAFLQEHFAIVSAEDVRVAIDGGTPLPERALLLTFDDGWADNAEYALPPMVRARFPGLLFMVGDRIGAERGFWQTEWFSALRARDGAARAALWRTLTKGREPPAEILLPVEGSYALIDEIDKLPLESRWTLLDEFAPAAHRSPVLRQMLDATQLRSLAAQGIEIGNHGMSHEPMTRVRDLAFELEGGRDRIAEALGAPPGVIDTLSFPHGRYTAETVARARDAGYRLIFTSDCGTNRLVDGRPAFRVLARVWPGPATVAAEDGSFSAERFAMLLLRQPVLELDGQATMAPDEGMPVHPVIGAMTPQRGGHVAIRAAWDADRPAMLALMTAAAPTVPAEDWTRLLDHPWRDPQRPSGWLAESDGAVVGFLGTVYSERRFARRSERCVNLAALWVREGWRGRGIARLLADRFLQDHRDHHVTVVATDERVRRFWRARGLLPFDHQRWFLPQRRGREAVGGAISLHQAGSALPALGLNPEEERILRFHRDPPLRSFVLEAPEGPCLLVTRVQDQQVTPAAPLVARALEGLSATFPFAGNGTVARAANVLGGRRTACELLYVSRPIVLARHAEEVLERLAERTLTSGVIVAERCVPARVLVGERLASPFLFRSESRAAVEMDALFSTLTLLRS